jgi:hypothetical protein
LLNIAWVEFGIYEFYYALGSYVFQLCSTRVRQSDLLPFTQPETLKNTQKCYIRSKNIPKILSNSNCKNNFLAPSIRERKKLEKHSGKRLAKISKIDSFKSGFLSFRLM